MRVSESPWSKCEKEKCKDISEGESAMQLIVVISILRAGCRPGGRTRQPLLTMGLESIHPVCMQVQPMPSDLNNEQGSIGDTATKCSTVSFESNKRKLGTYVDV